MLRVEGIPKVSVPCKPLLVAIEISGSKGAFLVIKNRFLLITESFKEFIHLTFNLNRYPIAISLSLTLVASYI